MYMMSTIGSDGLGDMLIPPEEKEQRDDAIMILNRLKKKFPVLTNASLTSHETLVAASLVEPIGSRPHFARSLTLMRIAWSSKTSLFL